MQLPIVNVAPLVREHSETFRSVFANRKQFQNAYKPVTIDGRTYYTFTMTVRIPSIGKVRIVISFDNPELQGN
ncbi:hypothetical protein KFU94_04580 [Chloroflexi bacterium TSY]|nr:hypothetical protein [Chloroflexi bacterium TSY]